MPIQSDAYVFLLIVAAACILGIGYGAVCVARDALDRRRARTADRRVAAHIARTECWWQTRSDLMPPTGVEDYHPRLPDRVIERAHDYETRAAAERAELEALWRYPARVPDNEREQS